MLGDHIKVLYTPLWRNDQALGQFYFLSVSNRFISPIKNREGTFGWVN